MNALSVNKQFDHTVIDQAVNRNQILSYSKTLTLFVDLNKKFNISNIFTNVMLYALNKLVPSLFLFELFLTITTSDVYRAQYRTLTSKFLYIDYRSHCMQMYMIFHGII